MRLKQWFLLSGVMAAVSVCLVGQGYPSGAEDKAREAPSEPKDVRKIPLDSIYSTSDQKDLKHVKKGLELERIEEDFRMGASNVLLVRGKDIATAVKSTLLAFVAARPADVPVDPEDGTRDEAYWLVAYFGTAGSGTAWLVESAERAGKTARVTYRKGESKHKDYHQYFAWVPLGGLEAGTYTLELFDAQKKDVAFLRRVTVAKK